MRRMTILWLALAAICSAVLFHTSQQVTDGRAKLAGLSQDARKEEESIRVLQAEWSYLNQPDRLEKLSQQYLALSALKGQQFTKLESIPDRPAPVAEAAPAAPALVAEEAPKPLPIAAAEKPAAEKPAAEKPAATSATTPGTTIVKFRKPAPPPAAVKKRAPVTAAGAKSRSFGDLMKSLGVR
jgi:hypothetical protein